MEKGCAYARAGEYRLSIQAIDWVNLLLSRSIRKDIINRLLS